MLISWLCCEFALLDGRAARDEDPVHARSQALRVLVAVALVNVLRGEETEVGVRARLYAALACEAVELRRAARDLAYCLRKAQNCLLYTSPSPRDA